MHRSRRSRPAERRCSNDRCPPPLLALAALLAVVVSDSALAGQIVSFGGYSAGSIVISTSQRQLYYVLGGGRDPLPGRHRQAGMAWHGTAYVSLKRMSPPWQAPPSINGGRYGALIPGGSPNNPMGVAVLGLNRGNYAIHGTNNPSSIGGYVSHGCIRMYNSDVVDLYARARVGTQVTVLR